MTSGGQGIAGQVERATDRLSRRRVGVVMAAGPPGGVHTAARGDTGRGATPDAHTLFEIGSVTKVFTALLLPDGVVRGQWRLDTPVRDLLPTGTDLPGGDDDPITLQHLATHTSGLPRTPGRLGLRENLAYLRTGVDPYSDLTESDVLAGLRGLRPRRHPGQGTPRYSNLGFGLLGIAMTSATGADFGALVRDRICGPLGMPDTVTEDQMSDEQRRRTALGHRSRRRGAEPWPLRGMPGAGALRSTAADMTRFLAAHLDPSTTDLEDAVRLTQATPPSGPERMGLGWHRAGPGTLWHNGGTGGFRSITVVDTVGGTLAVTLVNQTRGADLPTFRLLRAIGS
ncbi:serine hydrolase domain-containing protein [Dietzia maris]|uniref:serine hydrolase domain-containing protein n=1 Tax=Dietzia maris TaxID=37915 RepID=UPI00232B7B97|nr:serine hydrolase domain-containing protein [Dietzia maris]